MRFEYKGSKFDLWDSKYKDSLLFVAVSGSPSYGWDKEDSDIDIRLVWIENILQALAVRYGGKNNHGRTTLENGKVLCVDSKPMGRFLALLVKGNGNCLENLFQTHLHSNEKLVKEIQQLTMDNLHISFLKHFAGYAMNLQKDMTIPSRLEKFGIQKQILSALRILRAGLILGEYKQVVPNIKEQQKYHYSNYQFTILYDYLDGVESKPSMITGAKYEIQYYDKKLHDLIKSCKWYNVFPSIVFDRLRRDYYLGKVKK